MASELFPTASNADERRTRRTNEQRRADTRSRLLDATIRCLIQEGYHGTTTRRVIELSGVSQGAQNYHFPRRIDLVVTAIERLAQRRIDELLELAADFPTQPRARLAALLDIIWADFSGPAFTVLVELWVAAAHDLELHDRLIPVERQVAQGVFSIASEHFAQELAAFPDWARRLTLALSAIRGLALSERFEPREPRLRRDPWPDFRETLLAALLPNA